jgi:DNA polymerase-1
MGDGPVPSRIMLVGEAPGFREDEISKPFAGAAGRYLDTVLAEVGLPRASVFITNANKCRPPENRTPTKKEIKACRPYLDLELQAVQPDFVVPLGNVALESITGRKGIMKARGAIMEHNGYKILPTLHPAAILRNPGWEPLFKADLQLLARAVSGLDERPKTQVFAVRSAKSLRIFLKKLEGVTTPIAFDVETWAPSEKGGLDSWHPKGIILTCSFTWEEGTSYVVLLEHPEQQWDIPITTVYQSLNVALEGKRMVGHNVKFDMKWMRRKGVFLKASFDTMLAAHLLDENRPLGLKPLSRMFLGADEYEGQIEFDTPHQLGDLAIYNGKDTDYTFRLYHNFREELKKRPRLLRLFKLLVMPACNAFTEIESYGFPVDVGRLKKRNDNIIKKIAITERKLLRFIDKKDRPPVYNFRASSFLTWYFFEYLELPILEYTPKANKPSTKEAVLLKLRDKHPSVGLLMELRKWMKYESTYTRNWLARIRSAGRARIYTSYNISGTVTGRLSSDMQQVPRNILIRSIIGISTNSNKRRKGESRQERRFVEADFSQIELRIAAMFSRDPSLIKAFRSGGDPHLETAATVTGKAPERITKEERKMAKAVNFGFLYGMGSRKFRVYADEKYGVKVTESEAADYRKAFFSQYRGLLPWHDRQRRIVRNLGHVVSPIGRVRHLPSIESSDEGLQAAAEREAINSPVQGLASDLTVLSMVLLHERLDGNRGRVIGNVHDSILFEIDDNYTAEATKIIKETMENLPLKRYFGWQPTVPIQVEVSVSDHWGE